MELQQLRYFRALAENGNLTKTAYRLSITPPTLSNSISRLEEELGARLFDRVKGRLYLNETGRYFLESSSSILNALDSSFTNVRNMNILGKKVLSISTAVSSSQLSEILAKFLETHRDVKIVNKNVDIASGDAGIKENSSGLIVSLSGAMDSKYFYSRMMGLENRVFYLGVTRDHPLAKLESVRMKDLSNERFIFPPSDLPLTKSFYAICRNAGFEPNVIAECSTFLMTRFIEKGIGVTFVASTGFLNEETMVKVPILDVKNFIQDRFVIYWTKKHQLSEVENDFLEFFSEYIEGNQG